MWLGASRSFPDYMTQGGSVAKLEENRRELYVNFAGIPTEWIDRERSEVT